MLGSVTGTVVPEELLEPEEPVDPEELLEPEEPVDPEELTVPT
jgi:hypothetical protein